VGGDQRWTGDVVRERAAGHCPIRDSRADPSYSSVPAPGDPYAGTNSGNVVDAWSAVSTVREVELHRNANEHRILQYKLSFVRVAARHVQRGEGLGRITATALLAVVSIFGAQEQTSLFRRDLPFNLKMFLANTPGLAFTSRDFNGDGAPDLLVGSYGLSIILNDGAGRFGPPIESGYFPCGPVAVGDFNGDGKLDVVAVASGECGGHGHILLGRGDGSFQSPRALPDGVFIPVISGDFNGDGKLDIATFGGVGAVHNTPSDLEGW
jgi:VCBS repeat protein